MTVLALYNIFYPYVLSKLRKTYYRFYCNVSIQAHLKIDISQYVMVVHLYHLRFYLSPVAWYKTETF